MKERFGQAVVFAYNSQQSRLNVLTSKERRGTAGQAPANRREERSLTIHFLQ
jgi:hypothetical protein